MSIERESLTFPSTHWSLLGRCTGNELTHCRRALSDLLARYMPALRAHLRLAKRISPEDADDLLQSFIADKFLERDLIAAADQTKGKFRTLVLTALDRYAISEFRRAAALRRTFDPANGQDADGLDVAGRAIEPHQQFDIAWAREVLNAAVAAVRDECNASGRGDIWGVFESRILRPIAENAAPGDYAELVERFAIPSPAAAANLLVTAKRMFARQLRAVIAEYAASPGEIEDEIDDLQRVLASAPRQSE